MDKASAASGEVIRRVFGPIAIANSPLRNQICLLLFLLAWVADAEYGTFKHFSDGIFAFIQLANCGCVPCAKLRVLTNRAFDLSRQQPHPMISLAHLQSRCALPIRGPQV